MLWSRSISLTEVHSDADIVVEGEVAYVYSDRIPGLDKRDSDIGVHHLLKDDVKVVTSNHLGRRLWDSMSSYGFWTYRGHTSLKIGDRVRIALLWHQNADFIPVFFPYPGAESVTDLRGDKISMFLTVDNGHILDMPLRYGVIFGQFDPYPDIWYRLFGIFGSVPDTDLSYGVWRQAWPGNPQVTYRPVQHILGLPTPSYHYSVTFGRIAPFQTRPFGRVMVDTLAYTTWPVPSSANNSGRLVFNQDVNWSLNGSGPQSEQYDFVSVMAHEMGHTLGVGHLNSSSSNVMYESISNGETKRTLRSPDINAMTNIYG
ncbi:MAG: matrixin family metalloprotease [Pirellula sp.]